MLDYIRILFEIEERISGFTEEDILTARRQESLIVVEDFFNYLEYLWFEEYVEKTKR